MYMNKNGLKIFVDPKYSENKSELKVTLLCGKATFVSNNIIHDFHCKLSRCVLQTFFWSSKIRNKIHIFSPLTSRAYIIVAYCTEHNAAG